MKKCTIQNDSSRGTGNQGTSVFLQTIKGIALLFMLMTFAMIPNLANAQFMQQGPKLVATDAINPGRQGVSVSLSADGNTAIVGSQVDNGGIGAATIWTRSGGVWTELQRIVPTDGIGTPEFGLSVAMSADGNTVAIGGILDHEYTYNNEPNNYVGAVWVYINGIGGWSEQAKLIGQGYGVTPEQGTSVAISANGNTIIEGGYMDNYGEGASWVFQRTGSTWDGGTKLYYPYYNFNTLTYQGCSVAISADGTRVVIGAFNYDYGTGTAFMWRYNGSSWSEFDNIEDYSYTSNPNNTLVYDQGSSVAMSGDGNTIVVTSRALDGTENAAFTWIYDTYQDLYFPQAGMVGTNYIGDPYNGTAYFSPSRVAISYTGDTVVLTSTPDNGSIGAMWMFVHSGNWQEGEWDQLGNKYVGSDYQGESYQGEGVAMSYDGTTIMVGGFDDDNGVGATWVYVPCTSNNQSDVPTLGASQTFACVNTYPAIQLSVSGGNLNDASDWVWYSGSCGGTPIGTGTSIYVFPNVTTTYYARGEGSCVIPGDCGSITITIDNPTPTISGATTSCGPETLDGGAGYTSYEWQAPAGQPLGNTEIVTALYFNTYYLTVTDANGCTANTSLFVNIIQPPTPFISGGPNICTSGTLDAGAGYVDYVWSTGDLTESINVSSSGLYYVTVTDGNGCTGVGSINITIEAAPIPVITISNIVCGASATLDAGFWMDYQWNDILNQTTEQINLSSTDPYIYIVTVTDWNGCTGVSAPLNESNLSSFFPEEFEEIGTFPPPCWTESNNTGYPWSQNLSANGPSDVGFQSAMMDFWDIFNGGAEQLFSSQFSPTPPGFGLQFDEAYASNNDADDQLQILYSMDGGNTFNQLVLLDGGDFGPLNTGGDVNSNPFAPLPNQWQTMAFALPPGTNMVQFNGLSSQGNDLFIDNVNVLQFCNGTPNAGNISPTLICNTSGNFVLTGQSVNAGVTLQWQYSPDGFNFYNISGAASPSYSTPVVSATTYYQCIVTCAGSGQSVISNMVTLDPPPTPTIYSNTSPVFCEGNNDIIYALDQNSITYPEYLWSDGDVSFYTYAYGPTGIYSVTVTDNSGCTAATSIPITVNPNPTTTIIPNGPTTFCTGGNVTLDAGAGFAAYQWDDINNSLMETINVTTSGTYDVTVTDNNGCTTVATQVVNVTNTLNVTITPSGPTTFCQGGFVSLDAGAGYFSYNWSTTDITESITESTSGNYSVTVSDATGCTGVASQTVTVNDNPSVTAGDVSGCAGTNITLLGSPANGTWNVANPYSNVAGNYTYTYSYTDGNGCSGNATSNITVNSNPTVTTGDVSGCAGTNITLLGSPANGTWNVPNPYSNVAGNYSYTYSYTDGNGCSGNATSNITVNSNPSVTAGDVSGCAGTNITLLGSPANGTWNVPNPYSNVAGNYSYTYSYTDGNGCSGNATSNITVNSNPTVSAGDVSGCAGTNITLLGSPANGTWNVPNPYSNVAGNYTYTYSYTDGNGCSGNATSNITVNSNPTVTAGDVSGCAGTNITLLGSPANGTWNVANPYSNVAGNYSYTYSYTDGNGCSGNATSNITVNSNPTVTAGDVSGCAGTNITLLGSPANGTWNVPNPYSNVAGNYTYTYSYTDGNGCSGNATSNITVNSNPSVTAGDVSGCAGTNITLLGSPANGTWNVANPYSNVAGNYSYTYSYTDGNGCSGNATSNITVNSNPTVTAGDVSGCAGTNITLLGSPANGTWNIPNPYSNVAGNYSYTYSYTDGNGCSGNATSNITVNSNPTVTAGDVSGCAGTNITLLGSPANGTWNVPNPYSNVAGNYTYTYSYTDGNGCSGNATSNITVNSNPTVSAGDVSGCAGTNITLLGSPANGTWNVPNPYSNVAGNYTYIYSYTDGNGCSGNATSNITVNGNPTPVITPNGPTTFNQGGNVTLDAGAYSSYLWSNNAITETINVTVGGTYYVTVTNANGCTGVTSIVVTVNTNITLNPVISANGPTTFCSGSSVMLNAGNYTSYHWSTGANTQSITVSTNGNYSVTVTDNFGNTGVASQVITVNPSPIPAITGPASVCNGGQITLTTGTFNSYLWSTNSVTQSINVTTPATYKVTVTGTNGCTGVAMQIVTQAALVNPVITGPTSACSGTPVTIGLTNIYTTYLWSTNAVTPTITVNTTGQYSVTVTTGNCSGSTHLSVTILPAPAPVITGTNLATYCEGGNAILTVAAFQSYHWNTNAVTQSITVLPNNPGTYSITVTSANGCTGAGSYLLTSACVLPTTLATTNIAATTAYASWVQPSCVYGYTIRISKHGANVWTNYTITPNSHYTFSALAHNTQYDWQIQSNCNASGSINSGFSPTQTFTTLARIDGEEVNPDYAFNVYPNPANDHAIVAFTTGTQDVYTIRLMDVTGRIIQTVNYTSVIGENQYQLNLSSVAKGVYTVILQNGSTLLQSKIVVQ